MSSRGQLEEHSEEISSVALLSPACCLFCFIVCPVNFMILSEKHPQNMYCLQIKEVYSIKKLEDFLPTLLFLFVCPYIYLSFPLLCFFIYFLLKQTRKTYAGILPHNLFSLPSLDL